MHEGLPKFEIPEQDNEGVKVTGSFLETESPIEYDYNLVSEILSMPQDEMDTFLTSLPEELKNNPVVREVKLMNNETVNEDLIETIQEEIDSIPEQTEELVPEKRKKLAYALAALIGLTSAFCVFSPETVHADQRDRVAIEKLAHRAGEKDGYDVGSRSAYDDRDFPGYARDDYREGWNKGVERKRERERRQRDSELRRATRGKVGLKVGGVTIYLPK
jgi:hypothetical protein